MNFKAAIFDLDGVVVDTVPLHFKAWKKMFKEYGREFTFQDYKEKVDGIPRVDGARAILTDLPQKELEEAAARKQQYFLDSIKDTELPVFKETINLVKELKKKNIIIGIISSSRNCSYMLDKINLYPYIDTEVNGNDITKGKPDPQIFLMAKEKLHVKIKECIAFEDALLGVEAAKRAGMFTVGVDLHQDPERLKRADLVVNNLGQLDYDRLKSLI